VRKAVVLTLLLGIAVLAVTAALLAAPHTTYAQQYVVGGELEAPTEEAGSSTSVVAVAAAVALGIGVLVFVRRK